MVRTWNPTRYELVCVIIVEFCEKNEVFVCQLYLPQWKYYTGFLNDLFYNNIVLAVEFLKVIVNYA
jgi:hypothetical protein